MVDKTKRPGIMIYFDDIKPALNRMDDEQCGRLLRAIVSYAETGKKPETDGVEGLVFDMLSPKIDRDGKRYDESCEQRRYAVYVREKKKHGEAFLSFDEWRLLHLSSSDNEPISPDIGRYPTTTTTTSTSTTPTASASTFTGVSGAALSLGKGIAGGFRGEEGENQSLDQRRAYYLEKLGAYDFGKK